VKRKKKKRVVMISKKIVQCFTFIWSFVVFLFVIQFSLLNDKKKKKKE